MRRLVSRLPTSLDSVVTALLEKQSIPIDFVDFAICNLYQDRKRLDDWSAKFNARIAAGENPRLALNIVMTPQELHELQCDMRVLNDIKSIQSAPTPTCSQVCLLTHTNARGWPTVDPGMKDVYYRVGLHDELYKRVAMLQPRKRLLIIGNPGIDKSCCLNVLLWKALNDPLLPMPVVVRDIKGFHLFDPDHGYRNLGRNISAIVREMERVYKLQKVLLLHDCKSTSTSSLTFCDEIGTYQGFSIVLASSPDEDNYKEFVKVEGLARRFYYPPWTFDELKAVKPKLTQAGFDLIGGIPRHYDKEGQPSLRRVAAIRTAIETFKYDKHEPGEIPTIDGGSGNLTSKIVLWVPTDDYKSKTVQFVSLHASTLWLEKYTARALFQQN